LNLLVVLVVGNHHLGAAVLDVEAVFVGIDQGVYRDRDGADAHRGEEGRREGRRIVQHEQDPVLLFHAQLFKGMAEPVDAAGEFSVRYLLVAAVDGYVVLSSGLQVPVDYNACVVPFRHRNHDSSSLSRAFP
jgi:hypothetical protein